MSSQLNLTNRKTIETLLNSNEKLCVIADCLERDPRGIKYEIMTHRYLFVRKNQRNKCGIQHKCQKKRLCSDCDSGLCKYCNHISCDVFCSDFTEAPDCKRIKRFPSVCNGCDNIKKCSLPKFYYDAERAHREYQTNISEYKKGPKLDELQLSRIDEAVKEGVKKNHSIEVIIHNNNLDIAPSTLYRYIDDNLLSVKNIDLKRKVTYKSRTTNKPKASPVSYEYLNGRRFEDYVRFLSEDPLVNVWQMDTVEGKKGSDEAASLSLLHTKSNLQLYFKMKSVCQEEVIRVFSSIKKHLGSDLFKETFPCILTDNGKEFRDPASIEASDHTGESIIRVFYCEPRRSDQKGKCEKNHEHFREIVPKGRSMNDISISTFNYISNQVNNYPRKSLNYNSPYECALKLLNEKVFELNRLYFVSPDKVVLKHLAK